MKTFSLAVLAALFTAEIVAGDFVRCNADYPIPAESISEFDSTLQADLKSGIEFLCDQGASSRQAGSITLELHTNSSVERDIGGCRQLFNNILTKCITEKEVWGGSHSVDVNIYEIYNPLYTDIHYSEKRLNARAKKPSRPSSLEPAPPKPAAPKPAPPKPEPANPAPGKPKPKPSPSPSPKPSPTPNSKLPALKSCKQLAQELDREEAALTLELRSLDGQSPSKIQKRGQPKKASGTNRPCGQDLFWSYDYESFGEERRKNRDIRSWGFQVDDSCTDYRYHKGVQAGPAHNLDGLYETEHPLEWQVVADFFGKFLKDHFKGEEWDDPDPNEFKMTAGNAKMRNTMDFCKYWSKTWSWTIQEAHTITLAPQGSEALRPFQHLAAVYPSVNHNPGYRSEFTFLQKRLNGLKSRMFSDTQLYNEGRGSRTRPGLPRQLDEDPRAVLIRLRNILGARKYLDDKRVRASLADEKNRIQSRLAEILK